MNIESMRVRPCHGIAVDENVPPAVAERYRTLQRFDRLRAAGCGEAEALAQVGISRRTMYRWKRALAPKSTRPHRVRRPARQPKDVAAVMELRRRHPFMGDAQRGKARLHAMLRRRGFEPSASTVGRILSRAIAGGAIRPACFCNGLQPAAA